MDTFRSRVEILNQIEDHLRPEITDMMIHKEWRFQDAQSEYWFSTAKAAAFSEQEFKYFFMHSIKFNVELQSKFPWGPWICWMAQTQIDSHVVSFLYQLDEDYKPWLKELLETHHFFDKVKYYYRKNSQTQALVAWDELAKKYGITYKSHEEDYPLLAFSNIIAPNLDLGITRNVLVWFKILDSQIKKCISQDMLVPSTEVEPHNLRSEDRLLENELALLSLCWYPEGDKEDFQERIKEWREQSLTMPRSFWYQDKWKNMHPAIQSFVSSSCQKLGLKVDTEIKIETDIPLSKDSRIERGAPTFLEGSYIKKPSKLKF